MIRYVFPCGHEVETEDDSIPRGLCHNGSRPITAYVPRHIFDDLCMCNSIRYALAPHGNIVAVDA